MATTFQHNIHCDALSLQLYGGAALARSSRVKFRHERDHFCIVAEGRRDSHYEPITRINCHGIQRRNAVSHKPSSGSCLAGGRGGALLLHCAPHRRHGDRTPTWPAPSWAGGDDIPTPPLPRVTHLPRLVCPTTYRLRVPDRITPTLTTTTHHAYL